MWRPWLCFWQSSDVFWAFFSGKRKALKCLPGQCEICWVFFSCGCIIRYLKQFFSSHIAYCPEVLINSNHISSHSVRLNKTSFFSYLRDLVFLLILVAFLWSCCCLNSPHQPLRNLVTIVLNCCCDKNQAWENWLKALASSICNVWLIWRALLVLVLCYVVPCNYLNTELTTIIHFKVSSVHVYNLQAFLCGWLVVDFSYIPA